MTVYVGLKIKIKLAAASTPLQQSLLITATSRVYNLPSSSSVHWG
jgi:hypothetical protein